jgi:hypothetical protein
MRRSYARLTSVQRRQLGFLLVLLAYFGVLFFSMGDLSWEARLFPLITLGVVMVLWVLKLLATLNPAWRSWIEPGAGLFHVPRTEREAEAAPAAGAPPAGAPARRKRVPLWLVWGWVIASLVLMYLIGFLPGMAVAVICYLRVLTRETWKATLIATLITVGFVYFVFVRAMHVDLGSGLFTLF